MLDVRYIGGTYSASGIIATVPSGETWLILNCITKRTASGAQRVQLKETGGTVYHDVSCGSGAADADPVYDPELRAAILEATDTVSLTNATATEVLIPYVRLT